MKKRSYITISLLLFLASILTGCESINLFSYNKMENTVSDNMVTINYYTWERTEQNNPVIDEFTRKNPNIKVNVQLIPDNANSAMEKLDIMALGGGDMDV
jgi:ABC-type glycerol-3-phosphate transport system substrate-binding protein